MAEPLKRRWKAVVFLVALVSLTIGSFLAVWESVRDNGGANTPGDPAGEVLEFAGPAGFCPRAAFGQPSEVAFYEALAGAAPEGIAGTVQDLLAEARNLQGLRAEDNIEGMFRAAFDPDRRSLERRLAGFVSEECAIEIVCSGEDRQHWC